MNYKILLLIIISLSSFGQAKVTVSEGTVKVDALDLQTLYFGFAKGDQLVFNFQTADGKELTEVSVAEYPNDVKFTVAKTKMITDKTISVNQEGIYVFKFDNSAISSRSVTYKIERVPLSEATKGFNSKVYWETKTDTTFTEKTVRLSESRVFKPIQIVPSRVLFLDSNSKANPSAGKSRATFTVNLPKNTIEWYYQFSVSRTQAEAEAAKSKFALAENVLKLIDPKDKEAPEFSLDKLPQPVGTDFVDVYVFGGTNPSLFLAKEGFSYELAGTREQIKAGVIKIPSRGAGFDIYHIGLKNPNPTFGIYVAIEVVGLLLEEKLDEKTTKTPKTSTKKYPVLKN